VTYRVFLSARAIKVLEKLDRKTEQRLQARLDELAGNPLDNRLSKKLEMAEGRRYARVGDWRMVYEIDEERRWLLVVTIQHRSKVYKEII
jgi:mRNA-degrading endonuclease RelE of RelBE toxin-antitoxin system